MQWPRISRSSVIGFVGAISFVAIPAVRGLAAIPPAPPERIRSDKWPADSLEFARGRSGQAVVRIPDAPGLLGVVHLSADSGPRGPAARLTFRVVEPLASPKVNQPWEDADFDFSLKAGDVVPMLGAVYTVASVSGGARRVTLSRVTDADLLKEIGVDRDSAVIPLRRDVDFQFGAGTDHSESDTVTVKRIAPPGGSKAPEARLLLEHTGTIGLGPGARNYTASIHYSTRYAVGRAGVAQIIADYAGRPQSAFTIADYGCHLDEAEQRRRYVLQSLLEAVGLDLAAYRQRFESDAFDDVPQLDELPLHGLADVTDGTLRLTELGLERSDAIGPWLYSEHVNRLMGSFALT